MIVQGAKLGKLEGNQLTIEIPLHMIDKLNQFKPDDLVSVEIKNPKNKRTLQQNRYIWEIISQIDEKINGYCSDIMSVYIGIIKKAKIKVDYIQAIEQVKPSLESVYRFVEEVERRTSEKGESVVYRCYPGTSQFGKDDMSNFIESLIQTAYANGVDVHNYEGSLRGEC